MRVDSGLGGLAESNDSLSTVTYHSAGDIPAFLTLSDSMEKISNRTKSAELD